jgi:hypothetical protein
VSSLEFGPRRFGGGALGAELVWGRMAYCGLLWLGCGAGRPAAYSHTACAGLRAAVRPHLPPGSAPWRLGLRCRALGASEQRRLSESCQPLAGRRTAHAASAALRGFWLLWGCRMLVSCVSRAFVFRGPARRQARAPHRRATLQHCNCCAMRCARCCATWGALRALDLARTAES